jgi:hypothetical protein
MSGVKGRSGRRPLSVETHILRGTYRADRHGPHPVAAPAPAQRPVPATPTPPAFGRTRDAYLGP